MYGKVMSIKDDLIVEYFTLGTDMPLEKIEEIEKEIKNGKNPIEFKKQLAFRIVSELHNDKVAEEAQAYFEKTVQNKELPEDMPVAEINPDEHLPISELLVKLNLVTSRSEAKRLVEQGAVLVNDEVIEQANQEIIPEDNMIIKSGKRNYVRIKLSDGK
jgi:tyrosyl-tRNA synthetase